MSGEVDYYDVQQMIREALSEVRAEIRQAVRECRADSQRDLLDQVRSIDDSLASLRRVVDARTGHAV